MDNLTHSLFALTLARTPLRHAGAGTTAALLLSSNAPDIDVIAAFTGGTLEYLAVHRGPTHGPLGVIGLGLLIAGGVRLFSRRVRFWPIAGVSMLGVALHIALDLPTSYGTKIWSPFSATWYTLDWMPIVDVYLLAVLLTGLVLGLVRRAWAPPLATIALLLMTANYALRAAAHHTALGAAVHADSVPARCANTGLSSWPGDAPAGAAITPGCDRLLAALPSFVSPLHWRIVRQYPDGFELVDVDLIRGLTGQPFWYARETGPAVDIARGTRTVEGFLAFARFPAVRTSSGNGATAVHWVDLRFVGGILRQPGDDQPARDMFAATVEVDNHGRVIEERLGQ